MQSPESKLVWGKIPQGTECPFRIKCEIAQANQCHHHGVEHSIDFSCAVARGFDLLENRTAKPQGGSE